MASVGDKFHLGGKIHHFLPIEPNLIGFTQPDKLDFALLFN